jgi:beta-glucosidase
VLVPAGESRNVTIAIPVSELAYYNVAQGGWEVEATAYEFSVGNSSRNIQVSFMIRVE